MDDEEKGGTGSRDGIGRIRIRIEGQDDPLADAANGANDLSLKGVDRRIDRAQNEGAVEREALEAAPDDVARQRLEVDDDVGQLGNITFSTS
jgi:hypothetical protein